MMERAGAIELLGLETGSGEDEAKAAYRREMRKGAPGYGGSPS